MIRQMLYKDMNSEQKKVYDKIISETHAPRIFNWSLFLITILGTFTLTLWAAIFLGVACLLASVSGWLFAVQKEYDRHAEVWSSDPRS